MPLNLLFDPMCERLAGKYIGNPTASVQLKESSIPISRAIAQKSRSNMCAADQRIHDIISVDHTVITFTAGGDEKTGVPSYFLEILTRSRPAN